MAYVLLFAGFVLLPNLRSAPSLILLVACVLAGLWLFGSLGLIANIPRSDELVLCGAVSPLMIGITQMVYRLDFLRLRGLAGVSESGSAAAFFFVWSAEMLLVLLPGVWFLVWNARTLRAPAELDQARRPSRTSNLT